MNAHTRIYLDHAASAPLRASAAAVLRAGLGAGNPSSLHTEGRAARRRLEEARESVAARLGARPSEVVFTGGGTESVNLALLGIHRAARKADSRANRIVVGATEHHAVLDAAAWLAANEGAEVRLLPVDGTGVVSLDALRAELAEPGLVSVVSVMWANNEVGTLQPIAECAGIAAEAGVAFHTDAVQAVGHLPVDFSASGASALSLAAHKFGGPVGVGALLIGRGVRCEPLVHGGGHERGLRSGTQDAVGAVAAASALEEACTALPGEAAHVAALRDRLVAGAVDVVPEAIVNGPQDAADRLPGTAHLSFPGCEGDSLLMLLDARGIACSTGSACTAGVPGASHVLLAMGIPEPIARGSLRLSLGHTSTDADVDGFLAALPGVVERARLAGMAS